MEDLVLASTAAGVRTLTLNRPERRNAFSHALVAALRDALDAAFADPAVRVIVLAGAGNAFSAGADLDAMRAMQTVGIEENLADSEHLAALFRRIVTGPKVVVAKVHGAALGGGCGLAAAADLAVVADDARFGFTEVRLGFVPAIVAVVALRRVGETVARSLMLTGRQIDGREAARLGLVAESVPAADLDTRVAEIAAEIATACSPSALAQTKRLLAALPGIGFDDGLAVATQANAFARATPDFQAGIRAFLDKTTPPWAAPDPDTSGAR